MSALGLVGWLSLAAWAAPTDAGKNPEDTDDDVILELKVEERVDEAPDPSATSASVTVIAVDERLPASATVATAVDQAAGIEVQSLGGLGDWSAVSIRGSTLRQVQICIDGVPLNPDGASAVDLSELPLWAFRRIEVYRGNAPPELAAAPIGGVVDLRTGDGRLPPQLGLTAAGGSFGSARGGATASLPFTVGKSQLPGDVLVFAEHFSTRGDFAYFDDSGTRYNLLDDGFQTRGNNHKRQLSAHGRVRLGPAARRFTLMEALLDRDEGLPGHAARPTRQASLATLRSMTVAELEGRRSETRGRLRAWALLRREQLSDPADEIGLGVDQTEDRFTTLGGLAHGRWLATPWLVPALTASIRGESYRPANADNAPGQRISTTGVLSANARFWDERLTLSPVVQVQHLADARFDTEQSLTALNPRGGVLLRPWDWLALKANAGRYLRPPDFTELFGDRGAVIGNPELEPERGVQWDVGGRLVAPATWPVSASLELGHFWQSTTGLIVMVQNAQRTMVPLNLDDAWVQGWEGALSLAHPWVELQTSVTRMTSVNLSERPQFANNQLPRVPTLEVQQRTAVLWGEQLRLGHSYSYTAGNHWDRTNFYEAPPRPLHGAFLRAAPGGSGSWWPELNLDVHNLLDRRTEVVDRNPLDPSDEGRSVQAVTDFVGYPLAGRTVMITLRWMHQWQETPSATR